MPIDSHHPVYDANIAKWKRCRDAYEGEDAVKAAGVEYLPQLGGQDESEYKAYKLRALFYEAVGRTIDGFIGAVARKEPVYKVPAKFEPIVEDITADGVGLLEFLKKACSETLLEGRMGILVDFDDKQDRPFLTIYPVETIINWFGNGRERVILAETAFEIDEKDPFKQTAVPQIRDLALIDGVYTVTIWRKKRAAAGTSEEWVPHEEPRIPSQRGKAMDRIPFFWLTPRGGTSAFEKPPLLGMVNVSMSHYRSSADLEHGRHFTGLPTLWVSGVDNKEAIRVGSGTVLKLPDAASKCAYAEFTGQGLGSLERALESKEHMMAVLGAAVLGEQRKGVEAAETARIRTSGETSMLMGVVNSVEEVMEAALTCAASWMGLSEDIEIEINRDFVDISIDPPQLVALLQAWQAGAIDLPTFLFNLSQGEILPPDADLEAMATSLQAKADASKTAELAAKAKQPAAPVA